MNRRILIVDDNVAIHDDFKKILGGSAVEASDDVRALEAELFGDDAAAASPAIQFTVESAFQGREALQLVEKAIAEGNPYAMAFMDVRMPPGWDGIETTEQIWKVDPALQIVISTAYSDYSWDEMVARLGQSDGLVILKKPFDSVEVLQLAHAFTAKWNLNRAAQLQLDDLEHMVESRTMELRKEIAERTRTELELAKAKEAAEAASHAKSGFLANMSHEIRTPMNGVLGMCQLLIDSNLTPDQLDLATTLRSSSESLLSLLNDILDFSKIEADKLTLEIVEFSLEELIESTTQLLAVKAAEKDLELVAAIDPAVPDRLMGDPTRLRQILTNLLSNALKFTSKGEVALEVTLVEGTPDSARMQFVVRDTGIGMSAADQARLFQPFTQADTSITRRFGGTGLGLAICQRLVALMGGHIEVDSRLLQGSSFTFTLAFQRASGSAAAADGQDATQLEVLRTARVLVADAHSSNRKAVVAILRSWGAFCAEAEAPKSALSSLHAARQPFDAILVDHRFSKDGLSFIRQVRTTAGLDQLPILLMAPRNKRPPTESLAELGIVACLFKPFRKHSLQTALAEALPGGHGRKPVEQRTAKRSAAPLMTNVRILVAEDNPVNQKLAILQLKQLGYPADVAPNGRAAVDAFKQQRYDLVLMDCQMPELDGFEATRAIRALETATGAKPTPIVAMTAGAVSDDRDHCLACGMDAFITKPVRPEVLATTIKNLLSPLTSTNR